VIIAEVILSALGDRKLASARFDATKRTDAECGPYFAGVRHLHVELTKDGIGTTHGVLSSTRWYILGKCRSRPWAGIKNRPFVNICALTSRREQIPRRLHAGDKRREEPLSDSRIGLFEIYLRAAFL
jgi:hypothetical protein